MTIKSQCCNAPVTIEGDDNEGTHYYVCDQCGQACDVQDDDARIYPCVDCGKMRSKDEGGALFSFCDVCWDKHFEFLRASGWVKNL